MVRAAQNGAIKSSRPKPVPTPETQHFWDGARDNKLLLQRCDSCDSAYFPPRPFCPRCGHRDVSIVEASGRATLHTYVINQRPGPGFDGPTAIAIVELEEGPRMMTNIVNCPQTPAALVLDMAVRAVFEPLDDDITLVLFEPNDPVPTPDDPVPGEAPSAGEISASGEGRP